MLLVIDIGNTDTVFAIYHQGVWSPQWRARSLPETIEEGMRTQILPMMKSDGYSPSTISNCIISSVVPNLTPLLSDIVTSGFPVDPIILGPPVYQYLDVDIPNPDEMGTDLIANTAAAYARYQQACIVVDFGTALTFTGIGQEGNVMGVAIAPGLNTAMHALFHKAAQLPEVPLVVPDSALGSNTTHALQAGILLGYVGLVSSLLERIQSEIGHPCKVVATGGLSEVLTPLLERFDEIDRMLTLDGLRIIASQVISRRN